MFRKIMNDKKDTCDANLEIKNSDLKDICFINCDFSDQNTKLEVDSSFLGNANFLNVKWGKIAEWRICKDSFKQAPESAREVYRQLKLVHDKQKDHITANAFYALEMRAYEKQLKKEGWTKSNWHDRIVFTFHKWISNFGMSYLRPFVILLLLTNVMTYLSLISNENKDIFPWFSSIFSLTSFHFVSFIFVCILGLILIPVIELTFEKYVNIVWNFLEAFFRLEIIIPIFLLLISIDIFILNLSFISNLGSYFDRFAEVLNVAKLFKIDSNDHFSGFKLIYALYSILTATLIYQTILAIRRRVKR